MQTQASDTNPFVTRLRALFPNNRDPQNTDEKVRYDLEDPKRVMEAVEQACAHHLIYRDPTKKGVLRLTRETEQRLLNIMFTAGLVAVASRTTDNPFSKISDDHPSAGSDTFPSFEQQLALVIHRHIVRDDPNALQELFAEHLADLQAYLTGKAMPSLAFLMTCGVFVAWIRRQRPALHMRA